MTAVALRALPRIALAALLAGLAGCTTLGVRHDPGDPVAWDARRAALELLDDWQLDGRVAIADADDGYSGSLRWTQAGAGFDVHFEGPLGFGGLRIQGDPTAVTVSTSKGETFTVDDPERDLDARLGWSVPFANMRYWMVGIPDPDNAFDADYDAAGQPRSIVQQGWTVRYDEFHDAAPLATGSAALPRRFTLTRDDVRIKIVAERWTL